MLLIIFEFRWINSEIVLDIFLDFIFIRKIIISIWRKLKNAFIIVLFFFYLMFISFFETRFWFSFFNNRCHFWLKSILICKNRLYLVFLFGKNYWRCTWIPLKIIFTCIFWAILKNLGLWTLSYLNLVFWTFWIVSFFIPSSSFNFFFHIILWCLFCLSSCCWATAINITLRFIFYSI